jgi:cyclin-dependent kinase 2
MSKINVVEKLGEGAYGKVYKCNVFDMEKFGLNNETEYAIKVLSCNDIGFSPNEIDIISQIKHPYILPMLSIISNGDDPNFFKEYGFDSQTHQNGIIMPLAKMSFIDYIDSDKWNVDDIKRYFGQIALALDYLHSNNYLHLDIKLENVVINDNNDAMLIDFGQSQYVPLNNKIKLNTHITTTCYRPPELLSRPEASECIYNAKVDVWALGILFLEILQKKTCSLTVSENPKTVLASIKRHLSLTKRKEYINNCIKKNVNKNHDLDYFVELIDKMLEINPHHRITLVEVCRYLNVEAENKSLVNYVSNDFSSVVLNSQAIPIIKQILDEEICRISISTLFLTFDTFYRMLKLLDEKRLGMQCNIFIGCFNIAMLMNEKSYLSLDNYSDNVKEVYGMIWDYIVKGLQCNVRTHRRYLMSEEEIIKEIKNLYNPEEYSKLIPTGGEYIFDETIFKYMAYYNQ